MKEKKIIFYAPLGKNTPKDKIGGAEAGCLKTMQIYQSAGIRVVVLHKPAKSKGLLGFIIGLIITPIRLLLLNLLNPKAPVHIVGFYTKVAWYECLLMYISKLCGHKVIYELRNGSMVLTYKEGSSLYRAILRRLLIGPDVVLCQGMEYVDFIKQEFGIERSYYPNYIMDKFIIQNDTNRSRPINLIYFGRVTPSKNVDVVIRVLAVLKSKGIEAFLEIIGGYSDEYKQYLDTVIIENRLEACVKFEGRQSFSFIADQLRSSHYFVFPSSEIQEGHSNSLTEAMGCGVVPIASNAGFNKSICGEELIINSIEPEEYADKIIEIESMDLWESRSNEVYQRVIDNFTQKIVGNQLLSYVEPLFNNK